MSALILPLTKYDTSGNESHHGCFVLYTDYVKAVQAAYSDGAQALVAENARLLESLDGATRALTATQRPGGKRKTDPAFVMTPAMMDLGDRLLAIQGEAA